MWLVLTSIGSSLKRSSSDGTLTVRSAPCNWQQRVSQTSFACHSPLGCQRASCKDKIWKGL